MTTTFFCIETGNSLYGGTVRHFFNSPAAVMSFLKATREGWSLCAEHYTAETLATACENAARSFLAKANYLKIMARRAAA